MYLTGRMSARGASLIVIGPWGWSELAGALVLTGGLEDGGVGDTIKRLHAGPVDSALSFAAAVRDAVTPASPMAAAAPTIAGRGPAAATPDIGLGPSSSGGMGKSILARNPFGIARLPMTSHEPGRARRGNTKT